MRNEQADDSPKLTDEEIVTIVQSHYPDSSVRSPAKVARRRKQFNEGSGAWKRVGSARERGLRMSYAYDSEGNKLPGEVTVSIEDVGEKKAYVDEADIKRLARQVFDELNVEDEDAITTEDDVRAIVRDEVGKKPNITVVVQQRDSKVELDGETLHKSFRESMLKVSAGLPLLLVGPSGSGKTFLAAQLAKALELPFTFNSMSEGVSESVLLGRTLPDEDGNWKYAPSPFVHTYTSGGVHLLDEIDGSDPNLLVQVNAAIANRKLSIPFARPEPYEQHPDCVIIAAANTYGHGADRVYVGRNRLDAATLNRFTMGTVTVDFDQDLERAIVEAILDDEATAGQWLAWCWGVRMRIAEAKLQRLMSTRNVEDGAKLLKAGADFALVKSTFFEGWSADEQRRIRGDA